MTYKPLLIMVLGEFSIGFFEMEGMGRNTIAVVDDLRMCFAKRRHVVPTTYLVLAVGRHSHVFGFIVLSPDNDMLPVVPVAAMGAFVLLEVVTVQVGTPAIVATGARVDVVVP